MKLQQRMWMLFLTLTIASGTSLQAQVTIGAENDPNNAKEFAALRLVSTTSGLRYPQLSGTQITTLNGMMGSNTLAPGLMVFNTDGTGSLQYYVGSNKWVNLSAIRGVAKSGVEESVRFEGDAIINISDMENNNYVKEYSIQSASNQNIEIVKAGKYLDYENIVKSITFQPNSSGSHKITVEFYPKTKDLLQANNSEGAISVRLYAKYIEGGIEKQIDYIIQVTNAE